MTQGEDRLLDGAGLGRRREEFDSRTLRRVPAEIVEEARADPAYGISQEAAVRRAAAKVVGRYRRLRDAP